MYIARQGPPVMEGKTDYLVIGVIALSLFAAGVVSVGVVVWGVFKILGF